MARRSSKEWQAIIEQHETSGLSVVDFCKAQQLVYKYFHAKSALFKTTSKKPAPLCQDSCRLILFYKETGSGKLTLMHYQRHSNRNRLVKDV